MVVLSEGFERDDEKTNVSVLLFDVCGKLAFYTIVEGSPGWVMGACVGACGPK